VALNNKWCNCIFFRPTYLDLHTRQVLSARETETSTPTRLAKVAANFGSFSLPLAASKAAYRAG
jgi:hypothetical protein